MAAKLAGDCGKFAKLVAQWSLLGDSQGSFPGDVTLFDMYCFLNDFFLIYKEITENGNAHTE